MATRTELGRNEKAGSSLRWPVLILLALALAALAAYFQPLVVVALAAFLALVAVTWTRPFWVFAALLALLPFHDQLIRVVTWQLYWPANRITLLSLWKESIIVLLFAVMLIQHVSGRRPLRVRIYHFDLWLAALMLLAGAYIAVAANASIGVFGYRNYFEPLALFFLARLLAYSRQELRRLLLVLMGIAAVVAAYGIFQAQFIDFPTMISMGYVDEFGNLPFAFKTALRDFQPRPRAISTVTGPNQLAVYLNLFILLAISALTSPTTSFIAGGSSRKRPLFAALLVLYGLCLLLTFSRGGLLALGVSILAWGWILVYERGLKRTWREFKGNRWLVVGLIGVMGLVVAGLLLSGFARRVWRGITGQDPAALGHLTSMDHALGFISDHPSGIGLGMAGPRALRFLSEAQIEHTESTYLQFGMETGLVGMLLLLLLLLSLVATLWRLRAGGKDAGDIRGRRLTEVILVAWFGALAVFTVTPLMQNFLVASYLWLFAGFAFHLAAYRPAMNDEP